MRGVMGPTITWPQPEILSHFFSSRVVDASHSIHNNENNPCHCFIDLSTTCRGTFESCHSAECNIVLPDVNVIKLFSFVTEDKA